MTSDDPTSLLREVKQALEAAGIPYMVVGSFAGMVHGEPRTTFDLDIVIDPSAVALDALLEGFDPNRVYVDPDVARDALRRRTMFNLVDMSSGWKIDFVIRKDRPFSKEELSRRTVAQIIEVEVAVATAEDTIIAKLEWAKLSASERQLSDVAGILAVRGDDLDFAYVERWVHQLGLAAEWERARRLRQHEPSR
ncbi:MAG TPA: hypothetical protein VFQ65_05290 [Kofleriaceae bacterium]|nr:hypothetical protein [Kofleriaceae bacterium]